MPSSWTWCFIRPRPRAPVEQTYSACYRPGQVTRCTVALLTEYLQTLPTLDSLSQHVICLKPACYMNSAQAQVHRWAEPPSPFIIYTAGPSVSLAWILWILWLIRLKIQFTNKINRVCSGLDMPLSYDLIYYIIWLDAHNQQWQSGRVLYVPRC